MKIVASFTVLAVTAALAEAAVVSSNKAKAEFISVMENAVKEKKIANHNKARKAKLRKSLMDKAVPVSSGVTRRLDEEEQEADYGAFNFDASQYSIKYEGCAAIAQVTSLGGEGGGGEEYGGAEENGAVTYMKSFVTFRLCPSDSCNDNSLSGCKSDYGEYMLPLGDYLEAFTQYKEEVYQYFCEYCEQCMYFENYFYGNRKLEDEEAAEDYESYEAYYDESNSAQSSGHACKYYNECISYSGGCDYNDNGDDGNDDDEYEEFEYEELFECRETESYYMGNTVYLGPRCGDDGKTISITTFGDEWCTQYIGNNVTVQEVTTMQIEESGLSDYYDESCIPCKESSLPYKISQQDEEDADEMTELCEQLYESSAKCNKNLYDQENGAYGSFVTSYRESDVCTYISGVVAGEYDANGIMNMNKADIEIIEYIHLEENIQYYYQKLKDVDTYKQAAGDVSLPQKAGLVATAFACIFMFLYACFLRLKVAWYSRRTPSLLRSTEKAKSEAKETSQTYTAPAETESSPADEKEKPVSESETVGTDAEAPAEVPAEAPVVVETVSKDSPEVTDESEKPADV